MSKAVTGLRFPSGALLMGLILACSGQRSQEIAAPTEQPPSGAQPPADATTDATAAPDVRSEAYEGDAPSSSETQTEVDAKVDEQALSDAEQRSKGHCPANMILVEGQYCSKVEHKCKTHWYSKANKKKVCEEFEPEATCVGETATKRFCVDKYSWPNQEGVRPEVMNNFYQAQVKCAAESKRLCTESEWTMSCEGPRMLPFPYGFKRDTAKCNGDRPWDRPNMSKVRKRDPKELARLWQGVPSGSQPECVSEYGVHDLPGNNDEVVSSETYSSSYRGRYDSVHTGGPWYIGVRNQCRPKIYTHDEGFYYYFLGFRCCAEADGVESDPRVPKQIKRKWDFQRVERLARFTTEQMQEKLRLRAEGKCSCDEKDTLCKTMCGTLLGPGAKDVTLGVESGKSTE